jgi:hypothetical protein
MIPSTKDQPVKQHCVAGKDIEKRKADGKEG